MKHVITLIALFLIAIPKGKGQSYYYVPGHMAYHMIDRMDIKYGSETFHSSLRNYTRTVKADFLTISIRIKQISLKYMKKTLIWSSIQS